MRLAGAGTQTAGLAFGGVDVFSTPSLPIATEKYDGSAWTADGTLSTARYDLAGAGTQTVGLAFGGTLPGGPVLSATEEYTGPGTVIRTLTTS